MYIYGKNTVEETINSKTKINKIYISDNFNDKNIISLIEKNKIKYEIKNKFELDRLVKGTHQGIILDIEEYNYYDLGEIDDDVIVMLDHIEDPHNLGAIIRTCEAAGIKSVIIPKNRSSLINSTVYKTSVGTINDIKISLVTNLSQTIDYFKKKNYWIIGTDMNGDNYYDIDYNGKIVIIIGNEGKGISRIVKEKCDFIATIPMKGNVNSLNASVAAGIIIFEAIKRK